MFMAFRLNGEGRRTKTKNEADISTRHGCQQKYLHHSLNSFYHHNLPSRPPRLLATLCDKTHFSQKFCSLVQGRILSFKSQFITLVTRWEVGAVCCLVLTGSGLKRNFVSRSASLFQLCLYVYINIRTIACVWVCLLEDYTDILCTGEGGFVIIVSHCD